MLGFEPSVGVSLSALARLRALAFRRGVWFRALSRLDRGLVDLALRVLKSIRSRTLATTLWSIVQRLLEALEGKVSWMMRQVGGPLAEKMSRIAQGWGNKSAREWAKDPGFVRYLTVLRMNAPSLQGC
jgi:hypothetical protein